MIEPTPAVSADTGASNQRIRVFIQVVRNPLGLVGGILLLALVLIAVFAPLIAPHQPQQVHFDTPFQKALTDGFPLGTDELGRDVLSRIVYGIRLSLLVGAMSVAFAILVGTPLGLLAGYVRWIDVIVSRLTDVTLAFPFLIIAVGLAAINGPSVTNAAVALGIAQTPNVIRVIRAETLRIKSLDFILAARSLDATRWRILIHHILPNTSSALIVQATVIMPVAVIGESLLSFLGLGIQPPTPSLGIMLSDAQQYIFRAPSAAIFPGLAIAIICLAFNIFGDALRDALDPTSRKR